MLGLKLIHVCKRGHNQRIATAGATTVLPLYQHCQVTATQLQIVYQQISATSTGSSNELLLPNWMIGYPLSHPNNGHQGDMHYKSQYRHAARSGSRKRCCFDKVTVEPTLKLHTTWIFNKFLMCDLFTLYQNVPKIHLMWLRSVSPKNCL